MSGRDPSRGSNRRSTRATRQPDTRQRRAARADAREDVASAFDDQIEERDITSEDLVREDGEFALRPDVRRDVAASAFEQQVDRTISPDDVILKDEGAQLREGVQKDIAAEDFDEQISDYDVTPDDIEIEGGEAQLRPGVEQEIVAEDFDDEIDIVEIKPEDVIVWDKQDPTLKSGVREEIQAKSRARAVEQFDEEISSIEITGDDIVQRDGSFVLRSESRREAAAAELDAELEQFDITPDDLTQSGEGFELREGVQRSIAAEQIDEQAQLVDVEPGDLVETDDGFELAEDIQRERAAKTLNRQLPEFAVGPDDIEETDDGFEIVDERQREIAAERIDNEVESIDISIEDLTQSGDSFELREGVQREIAATQIDEEIEVVDIEPDDLRGGTGPEDLNEQIREFLSDELSDDELNDTIEEFLDTGAAFVLSEEAEREVAAEQINRELEDFDITAEDIRETEEGFELSDTTQRSIAAEKIDADVPEIDLGAGDVRQTDDGIALTRGALADVGVERAREDTANVVAGLPPGTVEERFVFAQELDEELSSVDISAGDVVERDGNLGLSEEARQEITQADTGPGVDVSFGETRSRNINFGQEAQREIATVSTAAELNRRFEDIDIGREDVSFDDGSIAVDDSVQREIAAERIDADVEGVDVEADDLQAVDGGYEIDAETQEAIAAAQLDEEIEAVNIGPSNVSRSDDGFGLNASVRRQLAAEEFDTQLEADVEVGDVELGPEADVVETDGFIQPVATNTQTVSGPAVQDGPRLSDDFIAELTAAQLDERFAGQTLGRESLDDTGFPQRQAPDVDVEAEDIEIVDGETRLSSEIQTEIAAERIDSQTAVDVTPEDIEQVGGSFGLAPDVAESIQREQAARRLSIRTGVDVDPDDLEEQQVRTPMDRFRGVGATEEQLVPTGESLDRIQTQQFKERAERGEIELFGIEISPENIVGVEERADGSVRPDFRDVDVFERVTDQLGDRVDVDDLEAADGDVYQFAQERAEANQSVDRQFVNVDQPNFNARTRGLDQTISQSPLDDFFSVKRGSSSPGLAGALIGAENAIGNLPGVQTVADFYRAGGRAAVNIGSGVRDAASPITEPIVSRSRDATNFLSNDIADPAIDLYRAPDPISDEVGAIPGASQAGRLYRSTSRGVTRGALDITVGLPALTSDAVDTVSQANIYTYSRISSEGPISGTIDVADRTGEIAAVGIETAGTAFREDPIKATGLATGYALGEFGVSAAAGRALGRAGRFSKRKIRVGNPQETFELSELTQSRVANLFEEQGTIDFPAAQRPKLYRSDAASAVRAQADDFTPEPLRTAFDDAGVDSPVVKKALDVEPGGPGSGRAAQGFTASADEVGINSDEIQQFMVENKNAGPFTYESPGAFVSPEISPNFFRAANSDPEFSYRPGLPTLGDQPTAVAIGTQVKRAQSDDLLGFAKELTEREGDTTALTKPESSVSVAEIEAVVPPGASFADIGTGPVRDPLRRLGIGSDFAVEAGGKRYPLRTVAPESDITTPASPGIRDFLRGDRAQLGANPRRSSRVQRDISSGARKTQPVDRPLPLYSVPSSSETTLDLRNDSSVVSSASGSDQLISDPTTLRESEPSIPPTSTPSSPIPSEPTIPATSTPSSPVTSEPSFPTTSTPSTPVTSEPSTPTTTTTTTVGFPSYGFGSGFEFSGVSRTPIIDKDKDDDYQIVEDDAIGWGVERVRILPDPNQEFLPEDI